MRWKGWVGRSVPVWSLLLCLLMPVAVDAATPVRVSVVRSTGTLFLGQTIWRELNAGWSTFGNVPVEIDYTSLAGHNLTLAQIQATQADVLVLSNPAFLTYTAVEINAISQYIEAGHGLVISYGKFRSADRALAPLVGLSESTQAGTNTWWDSFSFEILSSDHPVFQRMEAPYITGVSELASPAPYGSEWPLLPGAQILASAHPEYMGWVGNGSIVVNETAEFRGVYFSHYPENLSGGADLQDMQLFYNSLIWTTVPEPGTMVLFLCAGFIATLRPAGTPKRLRHHLNI